MNRQLHKKSIKAFFNSTSHFDFAKTIGRQARKGVVYTLTDAEKIVLEFLVAAENAVLFPKSKLRCNEEFKQDGLLMLDSSNSQSRKEFTASEKITQD